MPNDCRLDRRYCRSAVTLRRGALVRGTLLLIVAALTGAGPAATAGVPVAAPVGTSASAAAAGASVAAVGAVLRVRVAAQRAGAPVFAGGEDLISHVELPAIYADGGYAPLWDDAARVEALLATLREVEDDGLRPGDYHYDALMRLAARRDTASAATRADFDLLATDSLVTVLYHLYVGKVDPVAIEPNWNFSRRGEREREALALAQRAIASGRIRETAAEARPQHWRYQLGRERLAEYRSLAAQGGWETLPKGPKLVPGASDARVPALRRRLAVTHDYAGPPLAGVQYDAALVQALKVFQARHLLTADGVLGAETLRELNVPVAARVEQLRINLERGRWVLHEIGDGDLVVVDVAGFGVRYVHNRRTIWQTRAIVGRRYRQSPVFRAAIDNVVFNPTWTVPPGILAKDVLPGLRRGEDVLAHKQLGLYTRDGQPVDPATVDWSRYSAAHFPFMLRQDAGEENALGRVKINFPNPYLVYLHDTPDRALFDKDLRSFSSGCIRIERPLELVELLLDDPVHWDASAIRAAIDAGVTRTVKLPQRVPVLLIYWTADEDDTGRVVFKRDVYGRDARLRRALDDTFRFGTRARA